LKAIIDRLLPFGTFARYALMSLLALVTWWLAERYGPVAEKGLKLEPGKVDYYAKDFRRTVIDDAGKPKELLQAAEMTHYEGENRTELNKAIMTLFVEDGPPWVIHADTATLPGEGDVIYLNGNVLVLRDANRDGRTMRIETSNVRARPDYNYAETDEDIRVISPPDFMSGTGAKLKFGDGIHYSVLANVRRKHEVQAPKRP
jgi:lipopolysaccharide export system protein LptC